MQTVKWDRFPQVAHNPATRAFIEELAQVRKSPSTIDNYSRDLEDFLQAVSEIPFSDVLEADETLIAGYVDGLWSRPAPGIGTQQQKRRFRITGSHLALNTIRRRVCTVRVFYDSYYYGSASDMISLTLFREECVEKRGD